MNHLSSHVLQETGVFSMGWAAFWPADPSCCEKTRVEITAGNVAPMWIGRKMCKRIPLQFCSFNHKIINLRDQFWKKQDMLTDPHLAAQTRYFVSKFLDICKKIGHLRSETTIIFEISKIFLQSVPDSKSKCLYTRHPKFLSIILTRLMEWQAGERATGNI